MAASQTMNGRVRKYAVSLSPRWQLQPRHILFWLQMKILLSWRDVTPEDSIPRRPLQNREVTQKDGWNTAKRRQYGEIVHSRSCATFFRHSTVLSLPTVLLRKVSNNNTKLPLSQFFSTTSANNHKSLILYLIQRRAHLARCSVLQQQCRRQEVTTAKLSISNYLFLVVAKAP